MRKIVAEFRRIAPTKLIRMSGLLALKDSLVLLFFCGGLQTLPRQRTAEEIHQDEPERLHVVTTTLLNTQMSVDRSIARSTSKILSLLDRAEVHHQQKLLRVQKRDEYLKVWNVTSAAGILIFLRKTEVNDVADVLKAQSNN